MKSLTEPFQHFSLSRVAGIDVVRPREDLLHNNETYIQRSGNLSIIVQSRGCIPIVVPGGHSIKFKIGMPIWTDFQSTQKMTGPKFPNPKNDGIILEPP